MASREWNRWLKSLAARRRAHSVGSDRREARPRIEELETRLAPAGHTWSDADAANNPAWSPHANRSACGTPAASKTAVNIHFTAGLTGRPLTSTNEVTFANPVEIDFDGSGFNVNGTGLALASIANVGTNTLNVPVTLAADQTWTCSVGTLTVPGSVNLNGFTLTMDALGDDISFDMTGRVTGAGGGLKSGRACARLSGDNDYTGPTNVSSGILTLSSNNALGAAGAGNDTTVAFGGPWNWRAASRCPKH